MNRTPRGMTAAGRGARLLAVLAAVVCMLGTPAAAGAQEDAPAVDGVALVATSAAGVQIYYDPTVPAPVLELVERVLPAMLEGVPSVTGLPAFGTPIAVYLLADQERFRAAMQEIGRVRIELVTLEASGYTIEREGTMLIFFPFQAVARPTDAVIGFAHELAHLAVREASARRPVPQWLNEGYAQWISYQVLREQDPIEADELFEIDRAAVASALHGETGLLSWASLVNRTRFSRAGTEGWGNLAYGQSTLFVDWLAKRHGVGALAAFLQRIGVGDGATAAFQATIGPFGPEEAAFRESLGLLADNWQPGLRRVTRELRSGHGIRYVVIDGGTSEPIVVETFVDGVSIRRFEFSLDLAGFTVVGFGPETAARAADKLLLVSSARLGVLEVTLRSNGTLEERSSRPAPVQIPRRVGWEGWPMRVAA